MSSKFYIASALLLSVALAGCGSTKTASIDPGGNNGGQNGGNGGDGGNGNGNGGNGNGGEATTHNLKGRFLAFGKADSGNPSPEKGDMTITIAADEASADVSVAGTTASIPGGSLSRTQTGAGLQHFSTNDDNFLDLSASGDNYIMAAYVREDANNRYVGAAVGGNKTDQMGGSATYTGQMRAAVVPVGQTDDVSAIEATGDVTLNLNILATSATVDGQITNVQLIEDNGPYGISGQITLNQADVVNSEYSGTLTHNLGNSSGSGHYDGAFYGDVAAETAGTFEMDGAATPASPSYKVIGGFGASK